MPYFTELDFTDEDAVNRMLAERDATIEALAEASRRCLDTLRVIYALTPNRHIAEAIVEGKQALALVDAGRGTEDES